MRRAARDLTDFFLRLPGGEDVQTRFYQGLCLLGGVIALFVVVPVNAFQNPPVIVSAVTMGFGLVSFGLYWASRHGHYFPSVMFVALLITLNLAWFPNAATEGSIVFYLFPAIMSPVIFFRGIGRWAATIFVLANFTCTS